MKQFYVIFKDEKVSTMSTRLTWSHFIELLPLKGNNVITYYIDQCLKLQLTRDELREKIKSRENERLPEETKIKLTTETEIKVEDLVKNRLLLKIVKIMKIYQKNYYYL